MKTKNDPKILELKALHASMNLDEMYIYTSRYLNKNENELRMLYGHLNKGQQKMNLNNRIYNSFGYTW
jgi:hypothetical protein